MIFPTGNKGRGLAFAMALALALLAIAAIVIPAYSLHQRYDAKISEVEDKVDRYRKLASHKTEHQKAIELVKAREGSRFFLKNTASNLAGAELTDFVRPLIEGTGARLTSIQQPTVKEEAGFRLYTLNLGFNATPANLQKALFALDTAMPYLFLESVTLRATVPRGFKPQPNQEPEYTAQLEIQAYGFKEAPKAKPPVVGAVPVSPAAPPTAATTGVKS
jgi:general secretion pathway protein M